MTRAFNSNLQFNIYYMLFSDLEKEPVSKQRGSQLYCLAHGSEAHLKVS